MINWKIAKQESETIKKIVQRAERTYKTIGREFDPLQVSMDLTATHANGCRLRLKNLLIADVLDFAHDLFGIARHLNRGTGKLGDCFLPRCAQTEKRETT